LNDTSNRSRAISSLSYRRYFFIETFQVAAEQIILLGCFLLIHAVQIGIYRYGQTFFRGAHLLLRLDLYVHLVQGMQRFGRAETEANARLVERGVAL